MITESELPASVPGELSEADRQFAIALLQNVMKPREVRDALVRFSGGTSNKSIELIVAAAEHAGNPSQSLKLPDQSLIQLLMDVAGEDLLTDRELRRIIADQASTDVLEELHDYPSETRGKGGRATKVRAVASRKWHPGKAWANHFARSIGLPRIFAGSRGEAALDDALEVQPFVPLPLRADFRRIFFAKSLSYSTPHPTTTARF